MKIPFDIKHKDKILSGEYLVKTEKGEPVTIMDWEWHLRNRTLLAVKISTKIGDACELYTPDGRRDVIISIEDGSNLVLITPETLTPFESWLCEILSHAVNYKFHMTEEEAIEDAKKLAPELLSLAQKELRPELNDEIDAMYRRGGFETLKDIAYRLFPMKNIDSLDALEAAVKENNVGCYCKGVKETKEMMPTWEHELPKGHTAINLSIEEYDYIHYKGNWLKIENLKKLPGYEEM